MKIHKHILALALFATLVLGANAQSNFFTHTVSKGQTLYSISRMYQKDIQEIVDLNPGCDIKLSIGQELRIPQKAVVKRTPAQEAPTTNSDDKKVVYHTIKAGETLYRLGKNYNVTPLEICNANPGLSINNFRTGEVILIPTGKAKTEEANSVIEDKKTVAAIRTTHTVKRKETYEEIAKKYGITTEELLAANPDEAGNDKPKRKTILNIPFPQKTVNPQKNDIAIELSNSEIFNDIKKQIKESETSDNSTTRVAIILPFQLDSYVPSEQSRIVEYYEGFLLAVKELQDEGYSFDIHTYDSGNESASLDGLISSGKLDNMDLIIGAHYPKHNNQLAAFAKEHSIPLVIPFTSKEDEIFRNPMVYVVNTMQSYFFSEVTDHFSKAFPNAKVIFVDDTIASNKKEFTKSLKEGLARKQIPHTTIQMMELQKATTMLASDSNALDKFISPDRKNIFIPLSSTAKTLSCILPSMIAINSDTTYTHDIALFGYPEWQVYSKEMFAQFYAANTYFYASFFSHHSQPQVSEFQKEFVHWYNKDLQNIYPRYGMLGYDTGRTFLLAYSKYGKEMPDKINEMEIVPIQTGFKFERVNNWGGMVNKKIYFIHYSPDFTIEKIDFDK